MTLILHDYIVIIAKQTPCKDGFSYEKSVFDIKRLSDDELNKLYLEAQNIETLLQVEMLERENRPIVDTPSTGSIAGAES